jgi:D-tyrosyl-tRNA(Tyr) deacylase
MRVVIQRVLSASVTIHQQVHSEIGPGFMILLGIESIDTEKDIDWLVKKIIGLRIFSDENEKMNLSIVDIHGEILIVSQFTLHASCKKGNRPSFIKAASPDIAIPLYETFILKTEAALGKKVATGVFGADMKVGLINDGPVTIIMDSHTIE